MRAHKHYFFLSIISLLSMPMIAMEIQNSALTLLASLSENQQKLCEPDLAVLYLGKYICNCNGCNLSYYKKHNVTRHIQKIHPKIVPQIIKCPQKSCRFWFLDEKKAKAHFNEIHKIKDHDHVTYGEDNE